LSSFVSVLKRSLVNIIRIDVTVSVYVI